MKLSKDFTLPTTARSVGHFVQLLSFFYLPLYLNQLGFNGWQIGILFSIFMIAGFFFAFPIGLSNDKYSSRRIAIIGVILLIAAYAGLATFKSFYALIGIFLLLSFGWNSFNQSIDTFVLRNTDGKKKGNRFSIYFAARQTFAALGILVGGLLLAIITYQSLFIISSILVVGVLFVTFLLKKEEKYKFELTEYKKEIFKPHILLLLSAVILYAFHFGAEQTSYGLFLKNNLALTTIGMGWYMGLSIIAMLFTGVYLSTRLDKTKRPVIYLSAGLFLSGACHIAMTVSNLYLSFAFRFIHEIGDTAVIVLLLIYLRRFFSKEKMGGANGMMSFTITIGTVLGSLVTGPLGEAYGYQWPLILSGALAIVAVVPALLHRKLEKKHA